jgi:glucose/arabinose dehydrogenase
LKKHVIAASGLVALIVFVAVAVGSAQQAPPAGAPAGAPGGQGARGGGRGGPPPAVDTLGAGPWELTNRRVRVSVLTKGLDHPWGIAFAPDGSMLVTERPGRLRLIRSLGSGSATLDPTPLGPVPQTLPISLGGMLDVTLDPQFSTNRRIYLVYAKPGTAGGNDATTAVYRARWDGGTTLTEGKDIWVADAYHGAPGTEKLEGVLGPATGSYGARFAWDPAGNLFVSLGDRNIGVKAQDPNSHIGKIVRITTDGGVPKDNPFVGRAGWKPEIWTLGHRNPLGMYVNPIDGKLWSTEEGPQGGDELNLIEKGKNYGWPEVSLGRNYDGTSRPKGFSAPGLEEPVVYWVPAIAISGLSFYSGDKFPFWRGNAFVGGMRNNTGKHVQRVQFNPAGLPTGREIMFAELNQRIREVKPGPDGNLYLLTDETFGAVIKVEPPAPAAQ